MDEYARLRKRLQQGKLTEEQAVADAEKSLAEWDSMKEDITTVDILLQRNRKHKGQLEQLLSSLEVVDAKIRLVRCSVHCSHGNRGNGFALRTPLRREQEEHLHRER